MATIACATPVEFCAARITRLNSDGTVDYSTEDNVYVITELVTLGANANVREGEDRELPGGCGCLIASKSDDDEIRRYDLELTMGRFEFGALEMLTGGTVIQGTDGPEGFQGGAKRACGVPQARVAFEGWSKRWTSDNEQDPIHPWFHWVYPYVKWVLGNNTIGADFSPTVVNGKATANTSWGYGPYGEQPADIGANPQGVYLWDGDLPEGICDYSTIET